MSSDGRVPLLVRAELPRKPPVTKETAREIALLEREIVDAEVKALRASVSLLRPLYARRTALITAKLTETDFWPRVFSHAPEEVDKFILPSDADIIGSCLRNLTVERFSVNEKGDEGEPRNLRFTFEFKTDPEVNEWFDTGADGNANASADGIVKIVKEFYWRKSIGRSERNGRRRVWEGLVSEPVRIQWRSKEVDPTKGLLDAACNLAEAERKVGEGKKVTVEQRLELSEYETVVTEVAKVEAEAHLHADCSDDENHDHDHDHDHDDERPSGISFFAWFGYRGRDISAEESEAAVKEDEVYWAKVAGGEEVEEEKEKEEAGKEGEEEDEDDYDDDDDEDGLMNAEIFPDGDELAVALSEDLWENALKYYVQSFEEKDDFGSDNEFDMDWMNGDDDEEDEKKSDDENENEGNRPHKKVKTS
ncbi:hypothetical protein PABG_05425 [Paracoccidioides brasiliensis Pb03]|nr:hypothetical protein PABG_05425 [Paracoccidioides brasiliensis Pb03]